MTFCCIRQSEHRKQKETGAGKEKCQSTTREFLEKLGQTAFCPRKVAGGGPGRNFGKTEIFLPFFLYISGGSIPTIFFDGVVGGGVGLKIL